MLRRRMMLLGQVEEDMKVYFGTFVGDGTGDVCLDVYEEPDIISIVRSDADNISNGLTRGAFGMSITRDMYYACSYIANDGAVTSSNGGQGKPSGLYCNAGIYAEMIENGLHVHCIPASRALADGVTYEYVCIKYIQ